MESVNYSQTILSGGFWKQKQDMVRDTTVFSVYKRFKETGRFDAFKCEKDSLVEPHIFWDSDVAKWIEGVAYLTMEKREWELEAIVDEVVSLIEKNQEECGYYNSYYSSLKPNEKFTERDNHELYCLGHFIEASVAYFESTGKRKLLDLILKYVDYVEERFVKLKNAAFVTPGHEEIELALLRLYELTKDEKHLRLAEFFINERGLREECTIPWANESYNQSHLPVREQDTAQGHAVRAVYLYTAMADLAKKRGDVSLKNACEKLFDDIVNKKMYITGGIGSSRFGEAFTVDYDLSNLLAYTETCASVGLVFFAQKMLLLDNDSKYSNVIERALYNGIMSSTSLDGKSFYYSNPLEIVPYLYTRNTSVNNHEEQFPSPTRQEVFGCSCCPPNIVRFIPSIANLMYTYDDTTIYVHQYMEGTTKIDFNGKEITVIQKTDYPFDGNVKITVLGGDVKLAVRVPDWCASFEKETIKGYAYYDISEENGLNLCFDMKPTFIEANPNVVFNCGKYAVQRGPLIYCMEGCDNGNSVFDIRLDLSAEFAEGYNEKLGVPTLTINGFRRKSTNELYFKNRDDFEEIKATLIPYYAFANRGISELRVWHLAK